MKWRFRIRISLTLITAFAGFTAVRGAKADTVRFSDDTETPTVSVIGVHDNIVGQATCTVGSNEEACGVILTRGPLTNPTHFFGPGQEIGIAENSSATTLSDTISVIPSIDQVTIAFTSDVDGVSLGSCSSFGGCSIIEDGTLQTATTFVWSDGGVDTIQFCSDVEGGANTCAVATAVPEPSLILLLLTGLGTLAGLKYFDRVFSRLC
jgi:hypothetical protein